MTMPGCVQVSKKMVHNDKHQMCYNSEIIELFLHPGSHLIASLRCLNDSVRRITLLSQTKQKTKTNKLCMRTHRTLNIC